MRSKSGKSAEGFSAGLLEKQPEGCFVDCSGKGGMMKLTENGCESLVRHQKERIKELQREVFGLRKRLEWVQIIAKGMVPNELCATKAERRNNGQMGRRRSI